MALTHKFIPSDCKGEDKTLEGHIILRCPSVEDVLSNFSEMGLKIDASGQVEADPMAQIGAMTHIAKKAKDFCEEIDLKILSDGTKITSFEEFAVYPECRGAFMEVAAQLMNGFRPSKN